MIEFNVDLWFADDLIKCKFQANSVEEMEIFFINAIKNNEVGKVLRRNNEEEIINYGQILRVRIE